MRWLHASRLTALRQLLPWPRAVPARLARVCQAKFALAMTFSLLLHGLILALHFDFGQSERAVHDKALEVILVNSKSARKPSTAQALAQTNLDGGGNTEQDLRAKTNLAPASKTQTGAEMEQTQRRLQALEAKQQELLVQTRSDLAVAPKSDLTPPETNTGLRGRDLAQSALAMLHMEAEIAKNVEAYNKRPRKKNIGTRTDEYRFAQYVEDWRLKVERIGTLNYPEAARGKVYGSLIMTITIKSDGTLDKVEINRSSGQKILDDAARRIVSMAAPYAPFPPAIRQDTDVLEITRSWSFTNGDNLATGAVK